MKISRPLKWAPGLSFFPLALLLAPVATLLNSALAKESPKVALEAAEIRVDFRHSFGSDTELKAKSLAGAWVGSSELQGPFATPLRSPIPDPALRVQHDHTSLRGACELSAALLCYDPADGRIAYRSARQYMPQFDGFTAEGVSLRRNAIRFRYSFR